MTIPQPASATNLGQLANAAEHQPSPAAAAYPQEKSFSALAKGVFIGVAAGRSVTWLWMVVIITYEIINRRGDRLADPDLDLRLQELQLAHPAWAVGLIAVAGVFTIWAGIMIRAKPSVVTKVQPVVIELIIAGALLAFGELIYGTTRHTQTLASAWPLAGVVMAGAVFGKRWGIAAGVWLGIASYLQVPLPAGKEGVWSASIVSSMALWSAAGWTAGYLMGRLREAESSIASARAREEVARTLHDGVLQTLAVIQRRSDDTDLASMAREQELELRGFLTGATIEPDTLAAALRHAAKRHEQQSDATVQVVIAEDLPDVSADVIAAIGGAVRESLTNATKHGQAQTITIYAEPDYDNDRETTDVFCSVKDDGAGFDVAAATESIGVSRSIRGRLLDIGGKAEISSRVGRGTEVRLWSTSPDASPTQPGRTS